MPMPMLIPMPMLMPRCRCRDFQIVHHRRKKNYYLEVATGATIKKAVLKNSGIITGKHLRWSLFLLKLQTLVLQLY